VSAGYKGVARYKHWQQAASGTRRQAASGSRRAAFTLIELLVVLVLLVVLAGLVVPRLGGTNAGRALRVSAAQFAYTARTVRELAVAERQEYAVAVELDGGGFGVVERPQRGSGKVWQPMQRSWLRAGHWPPPIEVHSYRKPDGSIVRHGTEYLRFMPDGTSSGGALRLASGEMEYRIIVHPANGRVTQGNAADDEIGRDSFDLGD